MKRPAATRPQSAPRPTPAPRPKKPLTQSHAWLAHHLYVLLASLGQFLRSPVSNLMTAAVIGIALALPTSLYLVLENTQHIGQSWGGTAQISLFLKANIDDAKAQQLADKLQQRGDMQHIRVISRQEALQEYRNLSGFGEALNVLQENPLPAVIVLQPVANITPSNTPKLIEEFKQFPEVELAQFDMRWLQRLFAMMSVVERGVWILAGLLALAVLLIIGNTIRLAIYNRREEIEIHKLFGATDAFIRRPFLYSGLWYGFMGSILAWLLVYAAFWMLREPIQQLSLLYHSEFELVTLDIPASLVLLFSGMGLGLLGAWLAVGKHLRVIQPK
ncbi:MAG: permease-like cell division protein FtsX [Thiotrichaceae bacterium]|nr:permease-like cell division protein FtsX [Thiotrichaceae bacterium]